MLIALLAERTHLPSTTKLVAVCDAASDEDLAAVAMGAASLAVQKSKRIARRGGPLAIAPTPLPHSALSQRRARTPS